MLYTRPPCQKKRSSIDGHGKGLLTVRSWPVDPWQVSVAPLYETSQTNSQCAQLHQQVIVVVEAKIWRENEEAQWATAGGCTCYQRPYLVSADALDRRGVWIDSAAWSRARQGLEHRDGQDDARLQLC